jgi:hypothetical protein
MGECGDGVFVKVVVVIIVVWVSGVSGRTWVDRRRG